jgi:hypothetical protein
VTLDTNTIDHRERIEESCAGLAVEFAYTTVTDRETEGTPFATGGADVLETLVLDESRLGQAVFGRSMVETGVHGESRYGQAVYASPHGTSLDEILAAIGNGSFPRPGARESLTAPQRRQLRDAMVLEAHARERRDVLVSEDRRAFINHGRRERLEALCGTRIMTVDEFCAAVPGLI